MSTAQVDEKAVFNAARLIGDAAERERYLEGACHDDPEALGRIRRLLRAHDPDGSFLESPAVAGAATPEPPLESVGTTIGPYRLLEQIGEGGFGVVFMAEQTAPVRRKVALKVLKPGVDTRQVIARFEAERQALALMDHPHIAKVLDAGSTSTGRPYFVMELVRGIPITEYCDAHHLTPKQRLELFVTVCHAVQHAHQKGIIHRDLKPSNVLVTLHDDAPVAKVIDFGIAKATSGPLTDKTLFTGFAQMIGTPLYMSPEQAALSAIDVDTRSDVYSLGVLLYELLTGTTPFQEARLKKAAFDEVRRIIREEEPQRPSTRLSTADTLPTVAANRGMEPARLTRLVRGELDWIVMKALEKDRNRRYATANGLAVDVQRYLADEEVSACPPTVGYRLRKFVRRHRRALTTAAVVGAMLVVVAGMVQDRAARRGRNAEAVAVLLDQGEAALRGERTDQAALALDAAGRRAADGGAEELGDRLARAQADLALLRELDDIDAFRWTLVHDKLPREEAHVGRWQSVLADHGLASDEGRAVEAARRLDGSLVRDRVLLVLDRWLVADRSAGVRALLRAADSDSYRDAVRDSIASGDDRSLIELAARPEALAQPPRFASVLGLLPVVPSSRRRAVLETALRSQPGNFDLLMQSADVMVQEGATSEAVRWFQAAIAAQPSNIPARNNLALCLLKRKDLDGALAYSQEAIRLDPTFVRAHLNLGIVLLERGDPDGAIASFRESIRLEPTFASGHYDLGIALQRKGDSEGALASYRAAIGVEPTFALAHLNLGLLLDQRGDREGAIASYREVVRLDPNATKGHYNLSVALREKGDLEGAIASGREAIRCDPNFALCHQFLAVVLREKGDLDRSRRHLDEAVAVHRRALAASPDDAVALCRLGFALSDLGSFAEGVEHLRKGHDLGRRQSNWPHPSERWVKEAERLLALDARLPSGLAGEPSSPDELLGMARLCLRYKNRPSDAAVLYGRAFAAKPGLARALNAHRYDAARSAALGGCGRGSGAQSLEEADKARLRGLALDWLQAELAAHRESMASAPAAAEAVHRCLGYWLRADDLAGVRDTETLAVLPEEERQRWTSLWIDVRDLLARTAK